MPDADLALEGGGMKGIGLAGAVTALLRAGYTFQRVAGTSAGAITGALLATGIGERGLTDAMARLRYERAPDRGLPRIPVLKEGISLLHSAGATRATTSTASCATSSSASACAPSPTCVARTAARCQPAARAPLAARRHGDRTSPAAAATGCWGSSPMSSSCRTERC